MGDAVFLSIAFRDIDSGQSLEDREINQGADNKHEEGIAVNPVRDSLQAGEGFVLVIGERPDVTRATTVKVARSRVMNGVAVPPCIVGREHDEAGDNADNIV